jgi:hypothetical protein
MKAPVSLRFVSEADIQKSDYQPSGLGIFALLRQLIGLSDAWNLPEPREEGQENAKHPMVEEP